jgi:hypothetical protein
MWRRSNNGGAVVLSEFAGAAQSCGRRSCATLTTWMTLKDAMLGLALDPADGSRRMAAMRRHLRTARRQSMGGHVPARA